MRTIVQLLRRTAVRNNCFNPRTDIRTGLVLVLPLNMCPVLKWLCASWCVGHRKINDRNRASRNHPWGQGSLPLAHSHMDRIRGCRQLFPASNHGSKGDPDRVPQLKTCLGGVCPAQNTTKPWLFSLQALYFCQWPLSSSYLSHGDSYWTDNKNWMQ